MSDAAAQVLEREDRAAHPDRLTTRHGCRNVGELIQRATRVSRRTASDVMATARAVGRQVAGSTGELLPAEFPRLREALRAGQVSLDGVVGVVVAFRGCIVGRVELLAADEELAAAACGDGADAAPPASADELRAYARVWAAYLDQDGAEPAESRALRRRGITIGRRAEDGLVPVRGNLMPEVAAQLQLGIDSVLNPRVEEVAGPCFAESEPGSRGRTDRECGRAAHSRPEAARRARRAAHRGGGIRCSADPRRSRTHPGRIGARRGPRHRTRVCAPPRRRRADLARRGPAPRLHGRGAAGGVRNGGADRVDRDSRPCLQPPPASGDHSPRRRMPHSRLSRSPAVV